MNQPTARQQFAMDYTLIVDNDYEAYREVMDKVGALMGSVSKLSEHLREGFESYISQVVEREREQGNTAGADLIGQMLIGIGSDTFDDIARHYIDTDLEQRTYEWLNKSVRTINDIAKEQAESVGN